MTPVLGLNTGSCKLWQEVTSDFRTVFRVFIIDKFAPSELVTVELHRGKCYWSFCFVSRYFPHSLLADFSFI